ncbi:MAG: 2-oxoglutarate oxidoreductase [Anaerotignum sp.]|jgi:2-oxoglutarate ferredoxin oxidoreductase subunit beta|nr:2-oxoglutarate oxidoreductase [Anaerotignum sp.]MCI8867531.1 2-oxoglutarate oxidoreductase [Anaerotignum sp.]
MAVVFEKTKALTDVKLHYCPGCAHGIVHRLVAECLEEMDEVKNAIACVPVGCAVFANNYFNFDAIQCAHGRAPATATGIKRVHPDKMVLTYQGDGDLASIGTCEIVHAAARGEKVTTIFINNGIYGMTGGQMAPTTLPGMKATTAKAGRDPKINGNPLRVSEMLATLTGPAYIERVSVSTPAQVTQAKKAIKKALEIQKQGLGFTFIEVVSSCPTNWGLTPVKAMEFVRDKMIPYYPLGVFKDITAEEGK